MNKIWIGLFRNKNSVYYIIILTTKYLGYNAIGIDKVEQAVDTAGLHHGQESQDQALETAQCGSGVNQEENVRYPVLEWGRTRYRQDEQGA